MMVMGKVKPRVGEEQCRDQRKTDDGRNQRRPRMCCERERGREESKQRRKGRGEE
jgi:hypothetical protein